MLAFLLVAAWIWWGFSLLRLAGVRLDPTERLIVGPVVGLATGVWIVYLLAAVAGRLSPILLLSALGIFVLGGLGARMRPPPEPGRPDRWFVVLVAGLVVVLGAMNLYGVLAVQGGNVVAVEHVWADIPFHASIITNFAHAPNYAPTYPLALGEPLGYPFSVDFASAALVTGGFGLRASVVVVNVLIQVAFFAAVALIVRRLVGSARTAILAVVVLFLLGNLGFLTIPYDIGQAGGFWEWLGDLPWSYTGDALGDKGRERLAEMCSQGLPTCWGTGVYLGNPTFIYFLPRRSAAFGLAVGAVLLILFDDLLDRRHLGTAALAGIVLGLLPRIHAHSVMAMLAFLLVWCVLLPARRAIPWGRRWLDVWRSAVGTWLLVGGLALVVALPQIAAMSRQASGFVDWWIGWTGEPHAVASTIGASTGLGRVAAVGDTLWTILRFWLVNAGFLLLVAIPAWWRADRRLRLWYLPFAVLWLFGNLVRAQPWEWDNNNFFVYWQFGTVVLVAPLLADLLWGSDARDAVLGRFRRAIGVLLIVGLTLGGPLSFLYAAEHRQHLWTAGEVAFAEEVRERTPPDAAILTANAHGHPVIALSGRQTYMGFSGWFVSHGLDWRTFEQRLESMYAGDVGLMRSLGIDHVVIGPWERGFAESRGIELASDFTDPDLFAPVLRREIGGRTWELLELRRASDVDLRGDGAG